MKNRVCLICFNFGNLPNYYQLWLNSAGKNNEFDFLLFTDDKTHFCFPNNIKVVYTTFEEFKNMIREKYDFQICIDTPYKICDFRPAFGDILEKYLKEYDFWGTIDLDIILGNINNFIDDSILNEYDKILTRDHFCLYRNTREINLRYKGKQEKSEEFYKIAFTSSNIYAFGERGKYGVYNTWKYNRWKMFDKNIIADINPFYYNFRFKSDNGIDKAQYFILNKDNSLYSIDHKNRRVEYMYMHLQKRKMKIVGNINDKINNVLIFPNTIMLTDKKN